MNLPKTSGNRSGYQGPKREQEPQRQKRINEEEGVGALHEPIADKPLDFAGNPYERINLLAPRRIPFLVVFEQVVSGQLHLQKREQGGFTF